MNSKSPEVGGKKTKRRKMHERSDESKVDSMTSRDSSKGLEVVEGKPDFLHINWKQLEERVLRKTANEWAREVEGLMAEIEECTDSTEMAIRADRFCTRCWKLAAGAKTLATQHLRAAGSALRVFSQRYQKVPYPEGLGYGERKKGGAGREVRGVD